MNIEEVALTDTARSKCFRMIGEKRLKNIVKGRGHKANKEGVYKLHDSYEDKKGQNKDVVILFEMDGNTAVVITQKHSHHEN